MDFLGNAKLSCLTRLPECEVLLKKLILIEKLFLSAQTSKAQPAKNRFLRLLMMAVLTDKKFFYKSKKIVSK